jgi:hypothetical protein
VRQPRVAALAGVLGAALHDVAKDRKARGMTERAEHQNIGDRHLPPVHGIPLQQSALTPHS